MSWFRVDDGMLDHPKWKRAIRSGGDAVVHLWLALGTWCSRHLTDGMVPADMLGEIAGPRGKRTKERALRALLDERLLVSHIDGGVLLHDYLDYNPSRADVLAERERWARSKRKRRDGEDVHAGHSRESTGSPDVPSRPPPVPSPGRDLERARVLPAVPGLQIVGATARTLELPSETPSKEYLDEAVMRGVSREQALSTWEHYYGAGLPPGGVEKLYPWLCKRAKERSSQLAKAPTKSGPRVAPGNDIDTTGAATAFTATGDHKTFCTQHGLDLAHAVSLYRQGTRPSVLDTTRAWHDFMNRLKCWVHTGIFHADGALPKRAPQTKEATA
jgi:hypothetical protein